MASYNSLVMRMKKASLNEPIKKTGLLKYNIYMKLFDTKSVIAMKRK
jgi:hypothetical protein